MKQTFYERIGESVLRRRCPTPADLRGPQAGVCQELRLLRHPVRRHGHPLLPRRQVLDTPAGIAHYLEHKMFDTKEGNALQELAKNGAEPNAFTSNAMTGYYFDSRSTLRRTWRSCSPSSPSPTSPRRAWPRSRAIIGQEIRMIEDNPDCSSTPG